MTLFFRKSRWALLAVLCATATLAVCWPWDDKKLDFELTGRVLDNETKQPLEGAFVIAIYKEIKSGFAATANYCVKTRGMYTGKDGKFHFPIEKLNGNSPYWVSAIRPDYYYVTSEIAPPKIHQAQGLAAYTNRDVYLAKQDPAKWNDKIRPGDDIFCNNAGSREDVAASIVFYKIWLDEIRKNFHDPLRKQIMDSLQRSIGELETFSPGPEPRRPFK